MVLAAKAVKGANMVLESQRLPLEDSLLGGTGSKCTFLGMGLLREVLPGPRAAPWAWGRHLGRMNLCSVTWSCSVQTLTLGVGWVWEMWFWIQLLRRGREFNPELLLILEDLRGCYSNLMPAGKRQTPPKSVLWPTAWWQQRVPIRQEKSSSGWYPLEFICFVLSGQRERERSDRRVGPAASSWISEILVLCK